MKLGIEIRSGFWPLNKQEGFNFKYVNSYKNKKNNVSSNIFSKTLVLPSSADLKLKDIKINNNKLKKTLNNYEK